MANLHLEITGDSTGAEAAAARAQAAIDSLRGRSIDVNINVRGANGALSDMAAIRNGAGAAAAAHGVHAAAADRASASVRTHAAASERAGGALRGLASDAGRAQRGLGSVGDESTRIGRGLSDVSRSSEAARGSIGGLIREARGVHNFTPAELSRMSRGLAQFGGEAARAGGGLTRFASGAGEAGTSLGSMGGLLGTVGMGALYATAGMGLLTGATGALGVASAGSLGLIGAGFGAAGAGITSFAVNSLKDVEGFKQSFENAGRAVQGYSAWISEPYGAALVRMADQAAGSAPALAAPLRAASREIGNVAESNLSNMLATAAELSGGAQDLTRSAAPAFDAFFRNLPGLTSAAIDPMNQVTNTFGRLADRTFSTGVPAFRAAADAAGDFGSEMVSIGADNMAPALQGISSLTRDATAMAQNLRPAIGPSMQAFVDLGGAVMRGVGNSAPAIASFARTVSDNSFGIQQGIQGVIQGASAIGGATVSAVGAAGPVVERWGGAMERVTGAAGRVAGAVNTVAQAGGGWDNVIQGGLQAAGPLGQLTSLGLRGVGMLRPSNDPLFGALNDSLPSGTVSTAGSRRGGMPGQYTGFTASMRVGAGGMLEADLPAGAEQQIQAIQDRIDAGGLSQSQVNRLGQAQRNLRGDPAGAGGAVPPSNAFAGLPGGAGEFRRQFGSSAPLSSGAAGQQLSQIMRSAQQSTDAAAASAQRFGPAVSGALNQAGAAAGGSGVQQQMQGITRAVQAAPPAVQSAAAQIPPAVQQGVQAAPPSMAAPMQQMVRTAVQAAQPQAASGGASLGASVTGGTGQGITRTETSVLTIVKKWITRVIEAGASGLDAHSPSRKFAALGQSIPDGLAVGVQANAGTAITATQRAMGQVVQGATAQLGGAQTQLGRGLGAQLGGELASHLGATRPFDPYRDGVAGANAYARANAQASDSDAARRAQLERLGYSQATVDRVMQRGTGLERLGYSDATNQRIRERQERHNERAAQRRQEREQRRQDALAQANRSSMPEGQQRDIARWRAQQEAQAAQQVAPPQPPNVLGAFTGSLAETGRHIGQAFSQGMGGGVADSSASPLRQAATMAGNMVGEVKKKLGIASPSQVMREVGADTTAGLGGGLGSAVAAASAGVRGIASDRGLQVGYSWGRSMVTGADQVLKKDLFQAISAPQIDSPQAKAWLGAMGLLGPAGSGASIWKTPKVTLGSGASSATTTPRLNATINLMVDGQAMRVIAQDVVDVSMENLTDLISLQRG